MSSLTLRATVKTVTFHNPDNGWTVVKLLRPGADKPFAAVGTMPRVAPGETVELTGAWSAFEELEVFLQVPTRKLVAGGPRKTKALRVKPLLHLPVPAETGHVVFADRRGDQHRGAEAVKLLEKAVRSYADEHDSAPPAEFWRGVLDKAGFDVREVGTRPATLYLLAKARD